MRVGDCEYPGFPASGAGIERDPALRVAFFALLWDQDLNTPITVFARDAVGNEGSGSFDYPRVPETVSREHDRASTTASSRASCRRSCRTRPSSRSTIPSNFLASYLAINRELRRMNNETITALAHADVARDPVARAVQAAHQHGRRGGVRGSAHLRLQRQRRRQQVHLGFDLASTARRARARGESRPRAARGLARDLRQLRDPRSRHGAAVAVRALVVDQRERRADSSKSKPSSAAAAPPASRAAITCTSRCCSAATRSRRSIGGARSGSRIA